MLSRGCCRRCVVVIFGFVNFARHVDVQRSWQAYAAVCPAWWRTWSMKIIEHNARM